MATFTLTNTPFPDETEVSAYDATLYDSFPGANPPGTPVETATASNRSVTFGEVEVGKRYIAAGKVGGEWRYVNFSVEPVESPTALAEAGIGVVFHGNDASAARPDGFRSIIWKGTVEPTNAIPGDEYEDQEEEAPSQSELPIFTITGTTYTPDLSDGGTLLYWGTASTETVVTVPAEEDVAFPVGTRLYFANADGAARIKVIPAEGVDLFFGGTATPAQVAEYGIASQQRGWLELVKTASDQWSTAIGLTYSLDD